MSFRPYAIDAIGDATGAGIETLTATVNPGNTVEIRLCDGTRRTGVLVKQEPGLVVLQCRGWFGKVERLVLERSSVDLIQRISR